MADTFDNTNPNNPDMLLAACSFCGREADPKTGTFVFYGETPGVYICNNCIDSYKSRMEALEKADTAVEADKAPEHQKKIPTPKKLKEGLLDQYVIGQEQAKKTLATAVYNHYKMIRMKQRLEKSGNKSAAMDLSKSNMIIVGPTGAGKTHMLRVIAKKLKIPFVIEDSSAFTASGYVGSILRYRK